MRSARAGCGRTTTVDTVGLQSGAEAREAHNLRSLVRINPQPPEACAGRLHAESSGKKSRRAERLKRCESKENGPTLTREKTADSRRDGTII